MQIRGGGTLILERKSRAPAVNTGKLIDGYKYKVGNIVTD